MSDLISRSDLIKDLMEQIPLAENVHIFKDIIKSQPTVSDKEIRDKAIVEYQKECAKFILNKRNEFVNEIQRRASNRMREAIVADTRTVSCYKTGIKEGLEEAVEVLDEIAEQMKEVGE